MPSTPYPNEIADMLSDLHITRQPDAPFFANGHYYYVYVLRFRERQIVLHTREVRSPERYSDFQFLHENARALNNYVATLTGKSPKPLPSTSSADTATLQDYDKFMYLLGADNLQAFLQFFKQVTLDSEVGLS